MSPPAARPSHGVWRFLLKLAFSAALLAFLFSQAEPAHLWAQIRSASLAWLAVALSLYALVILIGAWRWRQLLGVRGATVSIGYLVRSYLVATFLNNFLPSNIGGDLVRIKDTVALSGSKTLATTVVLLDRGIGLLALTLIAAVGGTLVHRSANPDVVISQPVLWGVTGLGALVLVVLVAAPSVVEHALGPFKRLHQTWVEERLRRIVLLFEGLRASPGRIVNCLAGALVVQGMLVFFHAAVAASLRIPIPTAHLAILVPLSFVVQMLPVSVNGFGVREATFTAYFASLGLSRESALALSLLATGTIMVFSLSGVPAYLARRA